MDEDNKTEEEKDTIFEKEKNLKFNFEIGQMVQTKGFGLPYLVINRYSKKGHPFYDLMNYDKENDWRNYFEVIEEIIEEHGK